MCALVIRYGFGHPRQMTPKDQQSPGIDQGCAPQKYLLTKNGVGQGIMKRVEGAGWGGGGGMVVSGCNGSLRWAQGGP